MEIDLSVLKGKTKYYFCTVCGNLVEIIEDSGNIPVCCGKEMKLLVPGMSDGATEKHIPKFKLKHGKLHVKIGEEPHPMTPEHYIKWIAVQTDQGVYRRTLKPDCKPETCFYLHDDECVIAVFEYCNLHGLWMAEPDSIKLEEGHHE